MKVRRPIQATIHLIRPEKNRHALTKRKGPVSFCAIVCPEKRGARKGPKKKVIDVPDEMCQSTSRIARCRSGRDAPFRSHCVKERIESARNKRHVFLLNKLGTVRMRVRTVAQAVFVSDPRSTGLCFMRSFKRSLHQIRNRFFSCISVRVIFIMRRSTRGLPSVHSRYFHAHRGILFSCPDVIVRK